MNTFVQEAQEKLSVLQRELDSLNASRRRVEAKITALRAYLVAEDVTVEIHAEDRVTRSTFVKKVTLKDLVVECALKVLSDGRPRTTEELLNVLLSEKIVIGGVNKLTTLSSILSRDKLFQASRKFGWSLRNKESLAGNEAFDLQPTP